MKEKLDTEAARNLEELRVKELPDLPPLPEPQSPGPSRRSPRDRKKAPRQKVLEKPMQVLEQPTKAEVSVKQKKTENKKPK